MTHDLIYGEPTLAWDSGNRSMIVESVAEPAVGNVAPTGNGAPTGSVKPSPIAASVPASASRVAEPTMNAPLSDDFVYGERKLAWGSTFNTVEDTVPRKPPSGGMIKS